MASGASKFKFISPGIFINEIDESKLPADPSVDPGPTVIGRARRGPGMRPVTVSSFDEFVQTFGTPDPGAEGGDNWRSNDFDGPTYGAYAAQAWLVSEQSPINYVRLLGTESPQTMAQPLPRLAGQQTAVCQMMTLLGMVVLMDSSWLILDQYPQASTSSASQAAARTTL